MAGKARDGLFFSEGFPGRGSQSGGSAGLRESLKNEFQYDRLILLIGIMKDKDIQSILQTLAPLADHIILSRPHTERASSPARLLEALGATGEEGGDH